MHRVQENVLKYLKSFHFENFISGIVLEKFSISANFRIYSDVVTIEFAMKFMIIFDKDITFYAF